MKVGGPYKGSRSYKVAGVRKKLKPGKRRRIYVNDSSIILQVVLDYIKRVNAAGGIVEAKDCLTEQLVKYGF